MLRRLLFPLVVLAMVAGASPAQAESVWDPDDVDSPFDFRMLSAWVTPDEVSSSSPSTLTSAPTRCPV